MSNRSTLTEEQARYAMEHHELPAEVRTAAPRVAVILTQGWCPQWSMMKSYLDRLSRDVSELALFELVYDRVDYFDEFRSFKEAVWGNYQVPYVRYYVGGELVGESNFVPAKRFLSFFPDFPEGAS